ncbi:CD5 antigen-like isoform X2 [Liolophura sinensis]|uniref:CD5 antigen-like isoform X2 n=1 Tax=Liolophura sinensis TaxID=3198878 RepID=UPI003158191B
MGFNESLAHLYYLDEMAARNTILSLFGCLGNESRLIDCRHLFFGVLLNTCEKSAGVECRRSDDYSLRLSDSKNFTASNGRLDLKIAGQWKAVCGMIPEWTIKVACREMGLPTSSARMVPTSIKYPSENISIATEDFRCRGYESSITQCRVNHGHDDCNETFGIVCSGDPGYPVRLVGGDNSTGRLEVEISGIWGTVCNKTFDFWMAKVTCRALGFNKTVPLLWPNKDFGQAPPEQPAWLLSKTCFGHEDSLKNCFNGIGHKDQCTHETDVVISCKSLDEIDMPIRLVGGPDNTTGRLELFHDGQWGTVCSDLFGYKSAKVACRQLDLPYKGAIITKHVPISDPATGPVWLDKLQCRGEESHIIQCRHTIMPSCDHSKDVVLKCQDYIDIWNKYTKIRPKTSTLSTVTDNLKPKKKSESSAVSGSYIGSGVASAIGAILMAVGGCCAKSKWDKRANSAGGNENGVAAAQYMPGNANSSVETPVEGVTLISNDQNKTSAPPPSYSDLFGKEGDSRTTHM